MRQKEDIPKKLILAAIFSRWRRERGRYLGAKLKFEKNIPKYIKMPIFKTLGKLSRQYYQMTGLYKLMLFTMILKNVLT